MADRRWLWRALERRLARPSATRRRIGQALAFRANERGIGTGEIVEAEPFPMIVDKIPFGRVPVQMSFRDVEEATIDGALKDREVVLDRVGVPEVGADVFLGAVIHGAVASECLRRSLDRPNSRPSSGSSPCSRSQR
jgi:hypothetical protein